MCELCGQAHTDMVMRQNMTVCASRRHCMLYVLRNADELQIARMYAAALESTHRSTQAHIGELAS